MPISRYRVFAELCSCLILLLLAYVAEMSLSSTKKKHYVLIMHSIIKVKQSCYTPWRHLWGEEV
jgi:hypothetical protein